MKRKRDEEIEEENKVTLEKRRRMVKEKDQSVVIEQEETLPIPDPETAGQHDNQDAFTAPINTAAGGMDPNTANIFQQLFGSGGMTPPANHGHELPVPEWNQDMSFE